MFTVIDPGIDGLLPIGGEMSREDTAEAVWAGMLHPGAKIAGSYGVVWHVVQSGDKRGIVHWYDLEFNYPHVNFLRATQRRFIEERL